MRSQFDKMFDFRAIRLLGVNNVKKNGLKLAFLSKGPTESLLIFLLEGLCNVMMRLKHEIAGRASEVSQIGY